MAPNALFVYGTLMSPEVVSRVLKSGRSEHVVTVNAQLLNFQRHKVRGEYYPAAVPRLGHSIVGALVEGLTDEELAFMDEFEGDEYTRETVSVTVNGQHTECNVYVWCAGPERLLDEDWALDEAQILEFLATASF